MPEDKLRPENQIEKDKPGKEFWHLLLVILSAILWLFLLVLTYYTLLTLPAVLIVTVVLYLLIAKKVKKGEQRGWQNKENDDK
jgi:predicted membrane protein